MKTLVLYATKHGAAGEIARRIGQRIEGAQVCDLSGPVPDLGGFDSVIIGSAVYAGQLRKEAKEYVAAHAGELIKRPLGLYVSGMQPDNPEEYLNGNYPANVVSHARTRAMLGGAFDPAKLGFFEKLVMRIATKSKEYVSTVSDDKIQSFVESFDA